MQKIPNSALGRLSPEAFAATEKYPVVVVLDNIRSLNNVGSFFRTCDAFAMERIVLCGITATPPNKEIHKTALGAELTVRWDYEKLTTDASKADEYMKAAGYTEKNADGFYVNADGQAAAFTLTVNAAKETHVGYAEMIKTQLEAFGIQVNLDTVDKDAYNAKTSNKFSENNITMEAAIYGYTAAGMGMGNGLGSIYVDGNHAVQGGCQVFDEEFSAILREMKAAKTIEDYYTGAAKLQDYYAAHMPLIALYWDNMMLAYSSSLDNVTVDAVFGLNNVNNWFSITKK